MMHGPVNIKCMLYTTLIGPIFIYGGECWLLSKNDVNMFRIFERRILRMIYGPLRDNGIWRTRYSSELSTVDNEPYIVKW